MPRKSFMASMALTFLAVACGQTPDADPAPPPPAAPADAAAFSLPAPGTATDATVAANEAVAASLPLADRQDFENARKGLLAQIEDGEIRAEDGRIVWSQKAFDFLQAPAPATANPSLWRQAQLNAIHGLFEVSDGLYQLRGYDLSVMTLVRSDTGWIVIDPLLTKETAKAALQLAQDTLGERPVVAVIYTHSHADHFGGVRGVTTDEDVAAGRVRIIAPAGLTEEAISENILAGNHMARRARYMFGNLLPRNPAGVIDAGIGKTLSTGTVGFIEPTEEISATGERLVVDGVEIVFQNTPGSEAPAEFMFYLPQFRAVCLSEMAVRSLHNVLTLRGAQVRDALQWGKYLDETIALFGEEAEIAFASHHWPIWGQAGIVAHLENQRDLYRYIHDETLRLANAGFTLDEVAEQISVPPFQMTDFATRDYYGTLNHNSKATYQRYFGWFTGNPSALHPLPPAELAGRYVALAGGADQLLENAQAAFAEGDYRWVATLVNHLVFAEPDNEAARALLASTYEQLGFQAESSAWRNFYLTGAQELRNGVLKEGGEIVGNRDFVKAVPIGQYFDALAVRFDAEKFGTDRLVMNFDFEDTGQKWSVVVTNGVENNYEGHQESADLTIRLKRSDLDDITLGEGSFQSKLATRKIRVDGKFGDFTRYLRAHDQYDPYFAIVTP